LIQQKKITMTLRTVKKKLDELYGAREATLNSIKDFDFFKPDLVNYSDEQQEQAEMYDNGLHKTLKELDKKIVDFLKLAGL